MAGLLLLAQFLLSNSLECQELLQIPENDALEKLSDSYIDQECIDKSMMDNKWLLATQQVKNAYHQNIVVDTLYKQKAQNVKRDIESFLKQLEYHQDIIETSPAFQWAQSPEQVFLDIKFAHRLDSPGCLEIHDEDIQITKDYLTFTGTCNAANYRNKFTLNLELFDEVDPELSSYSHSSVGRLQVTMKKLKRQTWLKPNKGKKVANSHTWWEMKERYNSDMEKLAKEEGLDDY